jgi:hypothetical protein
MKKLLALIVFIGCVAMVQAQSRINIRTANESDFILFLNDVQVNNIGVISLTLDNIAQQKVSLKVNFPAQPDKSFQQSLALKKNTAVYYDIEEVKGAYKFVLKSESSVVINPNKNAIENSSSMVVNSWEEETVVETTLENTNCPDFVDDQTMLEFMAEMMEVRFESQKLSKMKAFVDKECVNAKQLGNMLLALSMEDNKLELLEYAHARVYDPSNLKGIDSHFFLERNKRKVMEMLNK